VIIWGPVADPEDDSGDPDPTAFAFPTGVQPRRDPNLLEPGRLAGGRYLVEEAASRGGFATVYRGTDTATGRPVALKVLHRFLATSREVLIRFQQEAETVARLQHPHVVELLELGELTTGQPFIAMEWLDGRNLDQEIRHRGPLVPADALRVMEELGAALSAAHALGVVHRDLKGANVLAVPQGDWFTVKLVDFGIAKLLTPERRRELTSSGRHLGTPSHMAPEQIRSAPVDARTDIYALGIMLHHLVTGQLPFRARTPIEVEEQHLHAPPPPASAVAPVSPAMDRVIAHALEKDPAKRPASVEELLVELRLAAGRTETPRLGVGLLVEISVEDGAGDEGYDRADALIASARERCAQAGLPVALEGTGTLLCARPLGQGRADVDALAVLLAGELVAPGVSVKLAVHVAPITEHAGQLSGDLLRLGEWPVS
jgi:eukaryotic-like serine/threonine-protein kinase